MKRQIITAVLVFTMILGGFFYYDLVVRESQKEAFQYAKDVASVQFDNITYAIDQEVLKYLIVEDMFRNANSPDEAISSLESSKSINQIFKNYSIYDKSGNLLLRNGIEKDLNKENNEYFKTSLNGEYALSYQAKDNKRRLDFYSPIRYNKVTEYVMVVSYFDHQIDQLLFNYFSNGNEFLDNSYTMIIDTEHNIISSLMPVELDNYNGQITKEEIVTNIKNGESGQFIDLIGEKNYTFFYQPLTSDMGLMVAVPYINLFSEHFKIFDSFAAYLLFCVFSCLIIFSLFSRANRKRIDLDKLTGILNKQGFEKRCKKALKTTNGVLIIVDVDNFKQVNDNYGHLEGDKIIMEVAHALQESFRGQDLVARFGGDEFVVFVQKQLDIPFLQRRLYFINEHIKDISDNYVKAPFSLSFGIQYTNRGDSYTKVFEQADHKLYVSKQTGKDQMIF